MAKMAAGACVSLSTCGLYYYTNQYYKQTTLSEQGANVNDNKNSKKAPSSHKGIFETDFTDKLATNTFGARFFTSHITLRSRHDRDT